MDFRQMEARLNRQDAISNLEVRIQSQRAALDAALSDLAALRRDEGLPSISTPDLPQPGGGGPRALTPAQATTMAAEIIRLGKVRRGEIPADMPPPVTAASPPKTAEGTAALAELIINAGRRARGEI